MASRGSSQTVGLALILTLLLCWAPPARGAPPARPASAYSEALAAISRGNFAAGVKRYYKYLIMENPLLSPACRASDLGRARQFFQKHLDGPKRQKALLFLCLIDRITLTWEGANQRIDEFLKISPLSALLIFLKGEFLLAQHHPAAAERQFQALLGTARGKPFLKVADQLLKRAGRSIPSIPADSTAVARARLKEAYRHWDLLNYPEAARCFEQVIGEFPEQPDAYRGLCEMLVEQKRFPDAIELLARWRKRKPEPLLPPVMEARLWHAQGNHLKAIAVLEAAPTPVREEGYGKFLLAESLFQAEKYDRAALLFRQLHLQDRINGGLIQRLAASLENGGKGPEAAAAYEEFLRFNSEDQLTRLEFAALLIRMREIPKARATLKKIITAGGKTAGYARQRLTGLDRAFPEPPQAGQTAANPAGSRPEPAAGVPASAAADPGKPVQSSQEADVKDLLDRLYTD